MNTPLALLLLSALALPPAAGAAERPAVRHFQQKKFPPPPKGACGLKSFTVQDFEFQDPPQDFDRARISVMGAAIETTSPDCIRDYAVVQFIRGCAYHSRYDLETGAELERVFDVARRLRGPRVVFNHPSFEVDSNDADPMYASDGADRLDLAYVAERPLLLRPDERSMLADLQPFNEPDRRVFLRDYLGKTAVTFITDVPEGGVSSADEGRTRIAASNTSLDFKTCVYRITDVPTTGDPAGPDASPENGGPLQCFAWMSRYTYDIMTKDFVTDRYQGVDPFCSQAPAREVLPGS